VAADCSHLPESRRVRDQPPRQYVTPLRAAHLRPDKVEDFDAPVEVQLQLLSSDKHPKTARVRLEGVVSARSTQVSSHTVFSCPKSKENTLRARSRAAPGLCRTALENRQRVACGPRGKVSHQGKRGRHARSFSSPATPPPRHPHRSHPRTRSERRRRRRRKTLLRTTAPKNDVAAPPPSRDQWRAMDTQLLFDADDRPGEGPSEQVGEPVADLVCDSPPFCAPLYAGAKDTGAVCTLPSSTLVLTHVLWPPLLYVSSPTCATGLNLIGRASDDDQHTRLAAWRAEYQQTRVSGASRACGPCVGQSEPLRGLHLVPGRAPPPAPQPCSCLTPRARCRPSTRVL
jgi:hypothetical protein